MHGNKPVVASEAPRNRRGGFSMIELVIVVVIIGIIAAIAIPRMSRGATGANEAATMQNVQILRNAIDLYQTEHGGTYPAVGTIVAQLTQYSDENGGTSATKTATHIYGPYLRQIPPLTVGASTEKGKNAIAGAAAAGVAWIYNATTGDIAPNAAGTDSAGRAYASY